MNKELRNVMDPGWDDHKRVTRLKRKKHINPCVKEYKKFLEKERRAKEN